MLSRSFALRRMRQSKSPIERARSLQGHCDRALATACALADLRRRADLGGEIIVVGTTVNDGLSDFTLVSYVGKSAKTHR
jgi:hypothetical protein